jgi:hypothetical protein
MVFLVAKDAERLTRAESRIRETLSRAYDVSVVSQSLSQAEMDRFETKRHPVDPMGASAYILSEGVDAGTALAYRTVMAPVIAAGRNGGHTLGVNPKGRVRAGEPLHFRDETDPPASMLDGGLPKACGSRADWEASAGLDALRTLVDELVRGG